MKRIEKLRNIALNHPHFSEEFYCLFYKKYEQCSTLEETPRYAEAFYYAFSNLTPCICADELIVGSRNQLPTAEIQEEWNLKYRVIAEARRNKAGGGQDSHMAIDYELVLNKGLLGIINTIDSYLSSCQDKEKTAYYNCCKRCLQGVMVHAENYAKAAEKMSDQVTDPIQKSELKEIARICKKVPAYPAESFYEAVQSVHFISHCLSLNPYRLCWQQFQLGHPDRYLLPYYEKDIRNGTLTKEFAQLLLDCLGIQINMRVPNGLSCGYMVGGRNEKDEIVANELTLMCMQVIEDVRLVYPAVGLCHTQGMPDQYLEAACSLLTKGYSHPAIFNDDVITKGLQYYGVPASQAHNYIHSTCVEITPVGASNVWVASPYTNMPQLLLDIMNRDYQSFDQLLQAYFAVLDEQIRINYENENQTRQVRAQNSINPLLSCFVNDCLKRGIDIEQGGAVYNWIMPSFVGMANLVDSLYAIKTLVFEEGFAMGQLKTILDDNFKEHEALRLRLLNQIDKYGNDIDEIDDYFTLISQHIIDECKKYSGAHTNANLIPSVFCWVMHERFGRQTSATPDGRKAGFPLGDGSGPCQGREMNGPTASVLSATKWQHHPFIGGVAVNLKFTKASLGQESVQTIQSIVKTYLKRGGFELQINVVDNQTLKNAQMHPEEYQDLVVRIGGYSDYFVRLSPEMQEEVILRTAHHA